MVFSFKATGTDSVLNYCDIHAHLCHKDFEMDLDIVLDKAKKAGIRAIVSNGLNPKSNDFVMELSQRYEIIVPAWGIYPSDAINDILPEDFLYRVERFDVNQEIHRIRINAQTGKVKAIGECGLDAHHLPEESLPRQEAVFLSLLEIAMESNLAIIVHSRKCEKRLMELIAHHNYSRVDFHCYTGKSDLAVKNAEKYGWYFSIPANSRKNPFFASMLQKLPLDRVLTETDAPYLSPIKGTRNDSMSVVDTVKHLAEIRNLCLEEASEKIWNNFNSLMFGVTAP